MKLSTETLAILKWFASINSNIIFRPGNELHTVTENKTILGHATIEESFDREVGIYDLSQFLSVLDLLKSPEIEFGDELLTIKDGKTNIQYFYAAAELLTDIPASCPTAKCDDVKFTLPAATLAQVKKAASTLDHKYMIIEGDGGTITVSADTPDVKKSNAYVVTLDDANVCDEKFRFVILIDNLRIPAGDYEIGISSKGLAHFNNLALPIEYFVAVERKSSFFGN